MSAPFVLNPVRESKDCTVRAFAVAAGASYGDAYYWLKRAGRRNRSSFVVQKHVQRISANLGVRSTLVARSGTVAKFLEAFPTGTFLVRKAGHMFAVVDGVVHDHAPVKDLWRVKQAWRVEKLKTEAVA